VPVVALIDIDTLNRAMNVYRDQKAWIRHTILSVAGSGKFSSDRTIREYAEDIWHVKVRVARAEQLHTAGTSRLTDAYRCAA